jgi:hypothetical protein
MKNFTKEYSYPVLSKQHESKLQELRHERKTEMQHLDGLKKALQTKLGAPPDKNLQAA